MNNFWQKLDKPFVVLAPMDDVTDVVFRQILAQTARPDIFFTEFTNVDALFSAGRDATLRRLEYTQDQTPIVGQIWGKTPENYFKASSLLKDLGFDGIDINMGCPDKTVVKNGCCSALIDNKALAQEIIEATIQGAKGVPVSVKTRLGTKTIQTEDWVSFLLQFDLAALTIHSRTAKEMSKVPAHWDEILKAVKIRNDLNSKTLIIGNGDVKNYQEALAKSSEFGVDGVMIGRGVFSDLLAFDKSISKTELTISQKLDILLRHAKLFENTWDNGKNFAILKKFFKIYISGFEGASDLRAALMETNSYQQVEAVIRNYLNNHCPDKILVV